MFTVEDMLNLKSFQGAQIIAGKEYIVNEVLNICVMEVPDITDYVKRGDFLITTLYPLVNNEDKMKKAQSKAIKRVIIAIIIFFVPTLINLILNIANDVWSNANFETCGLK